MHDFDFWQMKNDINKFFQKKKKKKKKNWGKNDASNNSGFTV